MEHSFTLHTYYPVPVLEGHTTTLCRHVTINVGKEDAGSRHVRGHGARHSGESSSWNRARSLRKTFAVPCVLPLRTSLALYPPFLPRVCRPLRYGIFMLLSPPFPSDPAVLHLPGSTAPPPSLSIPFLLGCLSFLPYSPLAGGRS